MIKVVTPSTTDFDPTYECTCDRCGCVFHCGKDDFACEDRPCSSLAVKCPTKGCDFYITQSKAKKLPKEPVNVEKKWQPLDMIDAIRFATRRVVAPKQERVDGCDFEDCVVVFTDGTALAVRSNWDGPLSEVTPEITATDPKWRVYR